jgi:hypothetical protein
MIEANRVLVSAFPSGVRKEALAAIAVLQDSPEFSSSFSVRVAGENLSIPERIYHDPRANASSPSLEREMLDCVFTRHANGYVRQERLIRIVESNNIWIPPFVLQLAGEYVIEIIRLIEQALPHLDSAVYKEFVRNNPEFIFVTKQRISSYWDCYYRSVKREEYPGFHILSFLEDLKNLPKGR